MGNMSRRLNAIEKQLQIGPKPELQVGIIRFLISEDMAEHVPEALEEWVMYRKARGEALEQLEKTGFDLFLFLANPKKEYEARLLEQATKSNRKQPNPRK